MSFLNPIIADLREKRLWPVALVLLAALVAVPVLLSGKSSSAGPSAAMPAPVTAPQMTALPAVSLKGEPAAAHLTGHGRDPFPGRGTKAQQATTGPSPNASSGGGSSSGSGSGGASSGSSGTSGGSSAGSSSSSGSGSGTTSTTTTTTTSTTPTPAPQPSGLTNTETYTVNFGVTNAYGGVGRLTAAERLTVLPSASQPLLVELGVLGGGHRVLFAVPPGTVVSGPGSCTPGPVDCQILSLGRGQTETISLAAGTTAVEVAEFAVTGISIAHHRTVAATTKARRAVSATGQRVLSQAKLTALSLFPYRPSLGVIVDERSLQVGGN
jgi:hypothetical protein